MIEAHTPWVETSRISAGDWWQKGWSSSTVSDPIGGIGERRLNFQYAGDLENLSQLLQDAGWKVPPASSWATLIEMLQPDPTPDSLPILPAAYHGRSEALLLHRLGVDPQQQMVLHIWPAAAVVDGQTPLWVGVIAEHRLQGLLYFFSFWGYSDDHSSAVEQLASDLSSLRQRPVRDLLLVQAF